MACRFRFPQFMFLQGFLSCQGWPAATLQEWPGAARWHEDLGMASQARGPTHSSVRRDSARAPLPAWREVPAVSELGHSQSGAPRSLVRNSSPSCPLPNRDSPFQPARHSECSELPLHTAVLPAQAPNSQPALTTPGCHRAALSVCQTCEMLRSPVSLAIVRGISSVMWDPRL